MKATDWTLSYLEIEVWGQTLHVMLSGCLRALNYRQSMLSLGLLAVLGHS